MSPAEACTSSDRDTQTTGIRTLRPCTAGSARALVRQAGVLVAVPFKTPKSGYKNPNSHGFKPLFDGTSTNQTFVRKVRAAADSTCAHKILVPYKPNAPRNMSRELVTNIVGKHYGVHPTTRPEVWKGYSQVAFRDPHPTARKPWKTTNQVFNACAQVRNTVGIDNPGISSDVAKRMHDKQGIYE